MENWRKYEKTYFMPPEPCYDWVKKDSIDKAPIWCRISVFKNIDRAEHDSG